MVPASSKYFSKNWTMAFLLKNAQDFKPLSSFAVSNRLTAILPLLGGAAAGVGSGLFTAEERGSD